MKVGVAGYHAILSFYRPNTILANSFVTLTDPSLLMVLKSGSFGSPDFSHRQSRI